MEANRKRKPLSDISNTYNLIPTSDLRKLVAATADPKSSVSKPPLSILKSSSGSTNQKFCSESSNRSDTSIGSSNVGGAWSSRTVQFRTPPRPISTGGRGSNDAAYNRKQMTEKNSKEREDAILTVSPTSAEKRKNKGKAIAEPFSPSLPEKMKDNQNENFNPGSVLEKEKKKGNAYRNLFSDPPVEIAESDKGTLNSYRRSSGKTQKGKAILNSSSSTIEKTNDGKKMTVKHSGSSIDGKKGILKHSGPSIMKTTEIGKELVNLSSFLIERTKEKGKAMLHSDVVEVEKPKGSSAAVTVNSRPPRRKNEKRKTDAGASSCPPMMRTKNLPFDLDEAGDINSSKSWTDAHPKLRKKRSRIKDTNELPLDFIEQQRAYFKEVDEFELPEEEISQDELD